ncbi:MAG: signal recognition particle protein [Acidobacteriia bacterium]|nr:signal recognition particle protein [Terriglobia bacterium]MBV8902107.1 signal recognition particle protein [Terriglobia bacterium]
MFDNLSEKLQRVFKNLRGEGKLTAENMEGALREIRMALLEADVNFRVVKQLIENIRQKAMGEEVLTALSPTQQVIKIVNEELIKILGSHESKLRFANEPPSVFIIVGLQGSGKTTTTGKLARWLSKNGHRPLLVSVDVYRPAAREQLKIIARDINQPIYEGTPEEKKPLDLTGGARRECQQTGRDVLLVDTAGRLHIDEELMVELQQLKEQLDPVEILFVADAMTGQDAVKSADEFHKRLGITGVILTKMDGDARGGAALSIRNVTGQPLKFVGVGEKFDALEPFHPDRAANRILGMGDVLSLIEKASEQIDQKKAIEMQRKLIENDFTLEDFRDQLRQVRKLGPLGSLLDMMPKVGIMKGLKDVKVDEKEIDHVVAIIDSMTPKERSNHMIINGSRRRRIAKGSGTSVQEVNQLLKQYAEARKMMKSLSGGMLGKKFGKMKLPPGFPFGQMPGMG